MFASHVVIKAFNLIVGINSVRQMEIFRILSGILHLGNVELQEDKSESSCVPVRNSSDIYCSLLVFFINSTFM